MSRVAAVLLVLVLPFALAGCGAEEGVAEGAAVAVYVDAPLCAGAERALTAAGGGSGAVAVRARCLPAERRGGSLDLATVGANARRAAEDSTSVAYLLSPDRVAGRFAQPILDAAGIGWVRSGSGAVAMRRALGAIEAAGESGALRESVREALDAPQN